MCSKIRILELMIGKTWAMYRYMVPKLDLGLTQNTNIYCVNVTWTKISSLSNDKCCSLKNQIQIIQANFCLSHSTFNMLIKLIQWQNVVNLLYFFYYWCLCSFFFHGIVSREFKVNTHYPQQSANTNWENN